MSKVIVPTIGRRVWFWESGAQRALAANNPSVQPQDAGVCFVWNERLVNLTVASHSGFVRPETSVPLLQPGDPWDDTTGPHCSWMPFQVGQAAAAPKPIE